jgi:hypothetical protein
MLELLQKQQHNDRLPVPLPLTVHVAHKTGELPGLRHDAGVVFAPSGTYVVVVMVSNAPSESDARATIVDLSDTIYRTLEAPGLSTYMGLAPRLAESVFRVPDAQGRLALLGDPRTETAAFGEVRVRPEVLPDLLALQSAAADAGAPFWIRSGFTQPTDADAGYAVPTEWILPCPIEQPARSADRPLSEADVQAAHSRQAWLGTTVSISDRLEGGPSSSDDGSSPAWQWLVRNAAQFGFVPALPESDAQASHEPWTLRWVGRDMAARLQPFDAPDYAQRALRELGQAENDLVSHDVLAPRSPADTCWTIATTSTRGCPSRWYFLGLPLS